MTLVVNMTLLARCSVTLGRGYIWPIRAGYCLNKAGPPGNREASGTVMSRGFLDSRVRDASASKTTRAKRERSFLARYYWQQLPVHGGAVAPARVEQVQGPVWPFCGLAGAGSANWCPLRCFLGYRLHDRGLRFLFRRLERFRHVSIARMADAGFRPTGMANIVEQILKE